MAEKGGYALHAQGDLRAAAGHRRHRGGAHLEGGDVSTWRGPGSAMRTCAPSRRSTSSPAAPPGMPRWWGNSSSRSWRGCRWRSTSPANSATATPSSPPHPDRPHQPERRDRRHPGRRCAKPRGRGARWCHLQRGGLVHRPRERRRHLHPRRARDRRRLHQGLHHPARRPLPARPAPRTRARTSRCSRAAADLTDDLVQLPRKIEEPWSNDAIEESRPPLHGASDFLYLGRGNQYPIALEGALKLKEISYIHAEGYPAGEMKHGPIALIDEQMPVVVLAPTTTPSKRSSPTWRRCTPGAETSSPSPTATSRGSRQSRRRPGPPPHLDDLMPVLTAIPLQLLAYHIAVLKGTDVDQPRNLAKSVTVE
jgi:hypothetical protein